MIAVLIAGSVAMILSLFGTRWLIAIFDSLGKGQPILGSEDHGPVHHMKKQGTATMGGIAIIFAAFIGWLVAHLRGGIALSDQAMIMWAGVGVLSLMGFLDDFLKVRKSHNRGILWKKKGYITFAMVIGLMWWLLAGTGISETLSFTRSDFPGWNLSPVLWVVWTAIMVWATTNAVNVTDGLDGLAAGSALFGFLAFTVLGSNGRCMWWIPVVERCASENFHGRCRCAGYWCSPGTFSSRNKHTYVAASHMCTQCDGGWLCCSADGCVQSFWTQEASLQDVTDPSPFRVGWLA